MRAGLLPALDRWQQLLLRPGERSPAELAHIVERVAQGERLVVAVDQFEELFAPSVAEAERRAFIDVLVEAAWDPDRRAVILLALRADFFGRLAPYVELADLLGSNQVLLGPMTAGELRRAIEGPAERAGLAVEPALVDALVDDTAGEPGGLAVAVDGSARPLARPARTFPDACELRAHGRRPRCRRPPRRGGVPHVSTRTIGSSRDGSC